MQTFVFDVNTKLSEQDGWIVNKTFLVMHLTSNFLLPRIRQLFGEYAGVGDGKTCHDVRRAVAKYPIIGFAEKFVLIVLSLIMEKIIDRLSAAVESLYVHSGGALRRKQKVCKCHVSAILR